MAAVKMMVAVLVLIGLGLVVGGFWRLHQINTGLKVSATVTECHQVSGLHGKSTVCTGSWATGNLLGSGHVVLGTINGVSNKDVGKNVTVRVHGDSAYKHSLTAPIAFFSVAAGCFAGALFFGWAGVTGRATGTRKARPAYSK